MLHYFHFMEQREFVGVSKPPAEVFEKNSFHLQESYEAPVQGSMFDKMEYPESGGMFARYFDHAFPTKGQPFPEAVESIQAPKKLLKATAYFASEHPIFVCACLLVPGILSSLLRWYIKSFAHAVIEPYFLDEKRYCRCVREVRRAGGAAIKRVGRKWREYFTLGLNILSSMLEWDNAYRYRWQDIVPEINVAAFLKNPGQEVSRLAILQVRRERGWFQDKGKFVVFGKVINLAFFMIPDLKKLACEFVQELNMDEVKMDEADVYHNLMRPDYDIQDMPMENRQKEYIRLINEYRSKNPDRLRDGQEKMERMATLAGLQKAVNDELGLPLMLLFAYRGTDGVHVKAIETKVLGQNQKLREVCRQLINKDPEKPKNENQPVAPV